MDSATVDISIEQLSISHFSETDLMNFERNQREFLHELNRKRLLLDECRQELNEAILKQHELQGQLDSERRKNENSIREMTMSSIAAKKMEETRIENRENDSRIKVELEIAKVERDALKEQTRALQHENVKLKRQLEDLEGKYKCQIAFQRDILDQQTKIKNIISQLANSNQNLMKDKEKLQNIEKSLEICSQLKLSADLSNKEKQKAIDEKYAMEKELIIKTAELETLKDLLSKSPLTSNKNNEEVIEYWKNIAKEQKEKLAIEIEGTSQLTTALKLANETILKFETEKTAIDNNEIDKVKE